SGVLLSDNSRRRGDNNSFTARVGGSTWSNWSNSGTNGSSGSGSSTGRLG
ncbi:hypothetical protein WICPIJ_002234, partial [Wickerhamomyces pijperi]